MDGSGKLDRQELQDAMTSLGIEKQKMTTHEFKELLRNIFEDKFFSPHEPTLPPDKLRVWKQQEAIIGTPSLCFRAFFLLTYLLFFFLVLCGVVLCSTSVAPCTPEGIGRQVVDTNQREWVVKLVKLVKLVRGSA